MGPGGGSAYRAPALLARSPDRPFGGGFRMTARKVLAALLAFIFAVTTPASAGVPALEALPATQKFPSSINEIELPSGLGTIQIQEKSSSGKPWVIVIQDAHGI